MTMLSLLYQQLTWNTLVSFTEMWSDDGQMLFLWDSVVTLVSFKQRDEMVNIPLMNHINLVFSRVHHLTHLQWTAHYTHTDKTTQHIHSVYSCTGTCPLKPTQYHTNYNSIMSNVYLLHLDYAKMSATCTKERQLVTSIVISTHFTAGFQFLGFLPRFPPGLCPWTPLVVLGYSYPLDLSFARALPTLISTETNEWTF